MIVASLVLLLGLAGGVVATQLWGLRLSGVLVVPLVALFTLYDITSLPIAFVSIALAYVAVGVVRERTLLYGRRLLYIAVGIGAAIPLGIAAALSLLFGINHPIETLSIGSILPGLAAYNLHRLETSQRLDDIVASTAMYAGLVVFGASLITPTTARLLGDVTPLFLFGSGSDIAILRTAVVHDGSFTNAISPAVNALVILAGIVVAELYDELWNVRLLGLVAVPLLALLFFQHPGFVGLYVVSVPVVYGVIEVINRRTLLYGRVLLSTAIGVGVVLTLALSAFFPVSAGYSLVVVAILAGVGGYNIHRVAPGRRRHTVGISIGTFVGFVTGVHFLTRAVLPFEPQLAVLVGACLSVPALLFGADLELKRRHNNRLANTVYGHS